ncbi:MAG TPA: DUF1080 domain-containing protein [Candidatus Sumerlaeota bacterium]|nr:DUF1080 domain-containing protein [Candidatus Sumerlaeota bacterium]
MIRRKFLALGVCSAVLTATSHSILNAAESEQPKESNEGFTSLFNGKDLTGWKGDPKLWKVEDGLILGSTVGNPIQKNTFLSTEKSYDDFVLRVKVKLRNHNSGIQFRSEQKPENVVIGYQADIAEKTYFGMLYEEGKRGIMEYWGALTDEQRKAVFDAAKPTDWNQYEITCEGDHIKMVLNGHVVCDITDAAGAKNGIIALQLHAGDQMEVRFKDLWIKPLKKQAQNAPKKDSAPKAAK